MEDARSTMQTLPTFDNFCSAELEQSGNKSPSTWVVRLRGSKARTRSQLVFFMFRIMNLQRRRYIAFSLGVTAPNLVSTKVLVPNASLKHVEDGEKQLHHYRREQRRCVHVVHYVSAETAQASGDAMVRRKIVVGPFSCCDLLLVLKTSRAPDSNADLRD